MAEADLSFIKSDIDLAEVAPIDRRQSAVSVNCIIMRLVDFLNDFAVRAEETILRAESHLRSADVKLRLLEQKLSQVELVDRTESRQAPPAPDPVSVPVPIEPIPEKFEPEPIAPSTNVEIAAPSQPEPQPASSSSQSLLVRDDPIYAKYFKMLKMGVPEQAVKLKMHSEGVDPTYLSKPDEASPNAQFADTNGSSLDSDSISSFRLLGDVQRGELDMACGMFRMTPERVAALSFSYPAQLEVNQVYLMSDPRRSEDVGFLFRPFATHVWLMLAVTFFIVTSVFLLMRMVELWEDNESIITLLTASADRIPECPQEISVETCYGLFAEILTKYPPKIGDLGFLNLESAKLARKIDFYLKE
ncbi:unnamed protein product [Caenorhabditis auriculariae]|uniref:Uncharacterized protein n=1 Tax=Caenorhabditis auriculariae TaxID=2777116 RepID=A0A8S1HJ11_9PELO|nr:unnamed protein product [Caenorhabditis auriculariae]